MFGKNNSKNINFIKEVEEGAKKVYDNLPSTKKRRGREIFGKVLRILWIGIVGIILLSLVFLVINIVNIKNVYNEIRLGKENIEQAVYFAKVQDFPTAKTYADLSFDNFGKAREVLEKYEENFLISRLGYIKKQVSNLVNLSSAAEMLSGAMAEGVLFASTLNEALSDKKNFTKLTDEEKSKILGIIYNGSDELTKIKNNIDKAVDDLGQVKFPPFLKIVSTKVEGLRDKVVEAQDMLGKAIPLSKILPEVFGYPDKSAFLVILQNSDELRPTGGFIGTYGIVEMENSDVARLDTHDIYHMDMPVKDKISIEPPLPLKEYLGVDKWFMRDSNWSPDWPTSAKKIEEFYELENNLLPPQNQINDFYGKFDGVIAVNPRFITDLIKYIGPIEIEGVKYNEKNFVDLLEYRVEKGYVSLGVPKWQRKEVIGKIAKEIKVRLLDLPFVEMYKIVNEIDKNLLRKDLMVYFKDNELQNLALEQGWGGNMISTEGDYLMVVDSNMASLKTDAVIKRRINHEVGEEIDGLFSKLEISYMHSGSFDWKTTRYRTYTRVYVPEGSELVQVGGGNPEEVEVYNEFGKTVFAVFFTVEPGKIGTLTFRYKLPDNILKDDSYFLYLQKQPGSVYDGVNISLNFNEEIKRYTPTGFFAKKEKAGNVKWENDFETDLIYKVDLANIIY